MANIVWEKYSVETVKTLGKSTKITNQPIDGTDTFGIYGVYADYSINQTTNQVTLLNLINKPSYNAEAGKYFTSGYFRYRYYSITGNSPNGPTAELAGIQTDKKGNEINYKTYWGEFKEMNETGVYGPIFEYYEVIFETKEIRGSFIGEVTADETAYIQGQKNSDGYWYEKKKYLNTLVNSNKEINKINKSNVKIETMIANNNIIFKSENEFSKLVSGTEQAGFFGEIPTTDLYNGNELASLLGITTGIIQNTNEPWLKFAYKGNILYVAKKPFRDNISFDTLNSVNAVYGNRVIQKNGKSYKIRLLRTIDESLQPDPKTYKYNVAFGTFLRNSEYNKLMLPIHRNASNNSWQYPNNVDISVENWNIGYSDFDLGVGSDKGACWCQETSGQTSSYRIYRGYLSIDYSGGDPSSGSSGVSWRPVLEEVK